MCNDLQDVYLVGDPFSHRVGDDHDRAESYYRRHVSLLLLRLLADLSWSMKCSLKIVVLSKKETYGNKLHFGLQQRPAIDTLNVVTKGKRTN